MKLIVIITALVLIGSSCCFAQKQKTFLEMNENELVQAMAADNSVILESKWVTNDGIECLDYKEKNDDSRAIMFYIKNSKCFRHQVMLPLDLLPETVNEFNNKYKKNGHGIWKNNTGSVIIELRYQIGETIFFVSYTKN